MAEENKSVQQMQAAGARLLQSSPGLAERMAASSRNPGRGASTLGASGGGPRDEREAQIADLQRQLEGEKEKNRSLEDQYKYRVASFVKRETLTKNKIEALERRHQESGSDLDDHNQRMAVIGNMHESVIKGLEWIQENTAKLLQDQEKDLMRTFRAKLQDVAKEVEAQRSRKGEQGTELQARHRRVVAELHEAQELAQTFDKKNQQLLVENQKLHETLRNREDDRQALLKELVLARKESARLKAQCKEQTASAMGPSGAATAPAATEPASDKASSRRQFSQRQIEQVKNQQNHNRQYEREVSYREAVTKLKRMVEAERKVVRALRQQQADTMQKRTELEVLLNQCLEDVKAEIARHRADAARADTSQAAAGAPLPGVPGGGPLPPAPSVHELTSQDRERVLELLLSQQRVVQLLYNKTFTASPPEPVEESPAGASGKVATKEDDFSWLSDIIPPEV